MEPREKVTAEELRAVFTRAPYDVDRTNNMGIFVTMHDFWVAVQQLDCKYADACKLLCSKVVFDEKARGFPNTMRKLNKALNDFRALWPVPSFSRRSLGVNQPNTSIFPPGIGVSADVSLFQLHRLYSALPCYRALRPYMYFYVHVHVHLMYD